MVKGHEKFAGIWLTPWKTLTQSHTISNHYESLEKFQGKSAFWFGWKDALKIKIFGEIRFSQTLVFTGFFPYWLRYIYYFFSKYIKYNIIYIKYKYNNII